MKKYFVAKEGIQKGPWTLDEITQNIQKKSLSWSDYIYDDRINSWLFLFEFSLLTEVFNKSLANPVHKNKIMSDLDLYKDRIWYILKSSENYGPFTMIEMIEMLQCKTLFEYDFIWRQDQLSWMRLADVPEFKPEIIKAIYELSQSENSETQKSFYRRKHKRVQYACELLIHNKQQVFSAQSVEISAGGASFKIENVSFPVGSEIYLHFKPGGDVPAFNATCSVVSKTGNKYGVSFKSISSTAKDSIEKLAKKAAA